LPLVRGAFSGYYVCLGSCGAELTAAVLQAHSGFQGTYFWLCGVLPIFVARVLAQRSQQRWHGADIRASTLFQSACRYPRHAPILCAGDHLIFGIEQATRSAAAKSHVGGPIEGTPALSRTVCCCCLDVCCVDGSSGITLTFVSLSRSARPSAASPPESKDDPFLGWLIVEVLLVIVVCCCFGTVLSGTAQLNFGRLYGITVQVGAVLVWTVLIVFCVCCCRHSLASLVADKLQQCLYSVRLFHVIQIAFSYEGEVGWVSK
jgi:hypothetical protein